jgi:hypothetical protein
MNWSVQRQHIDDDRRGIRVSCRPMLSHLAFMLLGAFAMGSTPLASASDKAADLLRHEAIDGAQFASASRSAPVSHRFRLYLDAPDSSVVVYKLFVDSPDFAVSPGECGPLPKVLSTTAGSGNKECQFVVTYRPRPQYATDDQQAKIRYEWQPVEEERTRARKAQPDAPEGRK